eukprot:COSAG02_NODE_2377_length_9006_cov_6.225864_1_plen_538_part_00
MPLSRMQPPRSSSATSTRSSGSSSWATGSPSPARSPSGSSWATGSSRASSDGDLESQSSDTPSSTDDEDHVAGGQPRKGEKAEEDYARHDDEERGGSSAATRQRRRRRRQREQSRPECCQTALLLIPALLVKASSCIVETCRRCCGGSTRRDALGRNSRRRDKPVRNYKYVEPDWDSDSSSGGGLSSASEQGPPTQQAGPKSQQALQHSPRPQRPTRRQRRSPQNDDGESTLSDTSSDDGDLVSLHAGDPAAFRARSRRSTTQPDLRRKTGSGRSEQEKPAAQVAQSSSDSDSDMENVAVSPVQPQQRHQRRQPQSNDSESSGSSSDDNFDSPRDTEPATSRASPRRSSAQTNRQTHAGTAETARAAATRRPNVASIVDQPAQQPDSRRAVKKPSTTLKLLPARSVQSASPTAAMQRVRQHSDLRASVHSDAIPHVEEWLAVPDGSTRTQQGVSGQRGLGGEELIHQLAATLREREPSEENSFIDPDFPPVNSSLYRDSDGGGGARDGAPLGSVRMLVGQGSSLNLKCALTLATAGL